MNMICHQYLCMYLAVVFVTTLFKLFKIKQVIFICDKNRSTIVTTNHHKCGWPTRTKRFKNL